MIEQPIANRVVVDDQNATQCGQCGQIYTGPMLSVLGDPASEFWLHFREEHQDVVRLRPTDLEGN